MFATGICSSRCEILWQARIIASQSMPKNGFARSTSLAPTIDTSERKVRCRGSSEESSCASVAALLLSPDRSNNKQLAYVVQPPARLESIHLAKILALHVSLPDSSLFAKKSTMGFDFKKASSSRLSLPIDKEPSIESRKGPASAKVLSKNDPITSFDWLAQ